MSESEQEQIARLLAEGLELFGEDRIEQAAVRWREVLRLDPGHREARDYLESAGFAGPSDPQAASTAAQALCQQALEQAAAGELDEALPLLRSAAETVPEDLTLQAAFELVRGHLYARYREKSRQGAGRPRVRVAAEQLLRFNLPPDAGFVLSMVDGHTRVDELLTVSGMDPFDVLHLLGRLEAAGIVEIDP
jgi:tetratricopeptide (TPR) repeat protein